MYYLYILYLFYNLFQLPYTSGPAREFFCSSAYRVHIIYRVEFADGVNWKLMCGRIRLFKTIPHDDMLSSRIWNKRGRRSRRANNFKSRPKGRLFFYIYFFILFLFFTLALMESPVIIDDPANVRLFFGGSAGGGEV